MKNILQVWAGKDLPLIHVKLDKGLKKLFYDLVIHPVKRRIAKLKKKIIRTIPITGKIFDFLSVMKFCSIEIQEVISFLHHS